MTWKEILDPAMVHPKVVQLKKYLKNEKEKGTEIYPAGPDIFRAFNLCPFEGVQVVILGQDPYPNPDTADGLCFSSRGSQTPASLQIIFKEIFTDFNIQYFHEENYNQFFATNSLQNWAENGFLLLNSTLTVERGKPGSHNNMGWEIVVDSIFDGLNKRDDPIIFLLWGKHAESYRPKIAQHHLSFTAPHPAAELNNPEGPKFSGCGHFSAIRDILPTLKGKNLFELAKLDKCFDKEKAKTLIRASYPAIAEDACNYIDKEMMIHIPVNSKEYWDWIRNFEKSF